MEHPPLISVFLCQICTSRFVTSFFYLKTRALLTVWKSLLLPIVYLSWKIAHGVLDTTQCLSSFGMSVPLPCVCEAPVESLEHLFFFCPLAQSVISWLQSLMFSFSPMCPVILCRHVLFGFNSDELRIFLCLFVYLLNVLKFQIWHSRNDFRFPDIPPGIVEVIAKAKTHMRFNLPLFFKRFQSQRHLHLFHRQWGAHGIIASVLGGRLTVKI